MTPTCMAPSTALFSRTLPQSRLLGWSCRHCGIRATSGQAMPRISRGAQKEIPVAVPRNAPGLAVESPWRGLPRRARPVDGLRTRRWVAWACPRKPGWWLQRDGGWGRDGVGARVSLGPRNAHASLPGIVMAFLTVAVGFATVVLARRLC